MGAGVWKCIFLPFEVCKFDGDFIVGEKQSSAQSRVPAVQNITARESAEILRQFQENVARQVFRDFFGHDTTGKDERYKQGQLC